MPLDIPQNYFELFRLPLSLEIDERSLTERYRALQRELHPDRFAAAGDQERRLAAQAAAHVNQGYRILSDRHERAAYLLRSRGVEVDEESDTSSDTGFLARQMELREEMEEIDDMAKVEAFEARLERESGGLWKDFAARYADERWPAARETLRKLSFYRRLRQALRARRERLPEG